MKKKIQIVLEHKTIKTVLIENGFIEYIKKYDCFEIVETNPDYLIIIPYAFFTERRNIYNANINELIFINVTIDYDKIFLLDGINNNYNLHLLDDFDNSCEVVSFHKESKSLMDLIPSEVIGQNKSTIVKDYADKLGFKYLDLRPRGYEYYNSQRTRRRTIQIASAETRTC